MRNRRHANEALPELVRRDDRRRHAGASERMLLVLLDVDHFKRINDSRGHAVGDLVLQAVAERLRQSVRGGDMLVRWGGEEFLVAFDGCDPQHAPERLRSLLAAISDAPVAVDGDELHISVSAGAAMYLPPDATATLAQALDRSIAQADAALYEAKRGGRDRAVIATPGHADGTHWTHYPRTGDREGT